jgi:exopolyphosphatase/guanosine-5'-triphosphate,3'-diphosphate pyrophosphatase
MNDKRALRVAAIDVGSNSIRLLVADVSAGERSETVATVARAGEPCRLGRGLEKSGLIEPALAERAAHLANDFVRRGRSLGARRFLIGGTAALRSASNGADVAARIAERTGVAVRVLSGEEEARLVYEAVVMGLGGPARRSSCVVFDLGGGSTEVVSGLGERAGRWSSLPFGAVSLTERFLHASPAEDDEVRALEAFVTEEVQRRCAELPASAPVLAGVGGTVTAFAVLDLGLEAYEPDRVEGCLIEASRLEAVVDRLARSSEADRRRMSALGKGRADIVVAGALAVRVLARRFQSRSLLCSTQGLRYGLARVAFREMTLPAPRLSVDPSTGKGDTAFGAATEDPPSPNDR